MEFPGTVRIVKSIEQACAKSGSGILVFYGEAGLGKTRVLKQVLQNTPGSKYYQAVPASSRQQAVFMAQRLLSTELSTQLVQPSYESIFRSLAQEQLQEKQILMFDEFDYLFKADDSFAKSLQSLLTGEYGKKEFLVILCTSSLGFVSGTMSKKMGRLALMIQGLMKMKEYSFEDMCSLSGSLSHTDVFYRYALMGGRTFPFQISMQYQTMRDMICGMFLRPDGFFFDYGIKYISEHLREPGVYATILYLIAKGHSKLNDLYQLSGFSRAKISVYLKNLIELDLVEKVYSYDASPRDDSLKGVYRISNPVIHFWYHFIYENRQQLDFMDADHFFDTYIMDQLSSYLEFYYAQVAAQRILSEKIPAISMVKRCEEWVGKSGDVPIIAVPAEGGGKSGKDTICCFTSRAVAIDEAFVDACITKLKKAGLKPKLMVLFSELPMLDTVKLTSSKMNVLVSGVLA